MVFSGGTLVITFRFSKTDQRGAGFTVRLGQAQNLALFPVRVLQAYLDSRLTTQGALFFHEDGSPLMLFQFRLGFCRALDALGVSRSDYGLHSFRIGAASTAARMGLPEREIQRIGKWRSDAFKYYVRDLDVP